ncbi:MAG: hypothetical protein GF334_00260 [Candidatus Altiarchaeales archaeon]|nr:hypothetical protein [Candidatus Altiarchaeales archaeon]
MTVEEAIKILSKLPPGDELLMYHEVYTGGGDESRLEEPVIVLDDNGYPYITVSYFADRIELLEEGPIHRVEEILG